MPAVPGSLADSLLVLHRPLNAFSGRISPGSARTAGRRSKRPSERTFLSTGATPSLDPVNRGPSRSRTGCDRQPHCQRWRTRKPPRSCQRTPRRTRWRCPPTTDGWGETWRCHCQPGHEQVGRTSPLPATSLGHFCPSTFFPHTHTGLSRTGVSSKWEISTSSRTLSLLHGLSQEQGLSDRHTQELALGLSWDVCLLSGRWGHMVMTA